MRYITRLVETELAKAARQFAALVVTGPRRAGKTTLLRHLFPGAGHVLLEEPDTIARVRQDPRGFLAELRPPVILDEIQNVPELLRYLRAEIDRAPRRTGRFLITGSQEAPLMRDVTESLAGRAAIFQLLSLAAAESPKVTLLRGGFPEVVARPAARSTWFRSYVQTYLERDVRAISAIRDLATFRRFLALVASRCGQVLNKTSLAGPLGVSVPTIDQWLSILETTGLLLRVPPYFENFGKRLLRSPKLYLTDSGLACHLLGIETESELRRSPFAGPVFEGFVAAELIKLLAGSGRRPELYTFRDQQGLEVDFLLPLRAGELALIEVKSSATVWPHDATAIVRLMRGIRGRKVRGLVVHTRAGSGVRGGSAADRTALGERVRAITVEELPGLLGR